MQHEALTRRVAVIGGGISGLTAALELVQRDPSLRLTLFECSDRPGGVLQTSHENGFLCELGPDSILRRLPWGMELCQRVGLGDEMIPTEATASGVYTVHRGSLVRMPEALVFGAPGKIWPIVRTPILSWRGKLRMARERILPARSDERDESLAQFARRRFGNETLQRIIQPMASGIYMGDSELLGMRASFPQLVAAEQEHGSLIKWRHRTMVKSAKSNAAAQESLFTAPRRGFSQLVDAIVNRLPEGALRLNHAVRSVTRCERGWRVRGTTPADGGSFDEEFDWAVLATPARQAGQIVAETDQPLQRLLDSIQHTSCVVVNLAYTRDAIGQPLDAAGFVVPHIERQTLNACTYSSVKYRGRSPSEFVLLRVFLGGAQNPELIDADDAELLHIARRELQQLLHLKGEPVLQRLARWRDKMPQYYVGHLDRVREIENRVAQLKGLELAGNAFRGVGVPHCIHSAQQAVTRLFSDNGNNA